MSGFYIDTDALKAVQFAMGASHSQMVGAFNKAVRQTVNHLRKISTNKLVKTTGVKNRKLVQGRVRKAVKKVSRAGFTADTGRIWIGLDDVPVSALRGRMKSRRGVIYQDRDRDAKGRFLKENGGNNATFTPVASSVLHAKTFDNSFIGTIKGRHTIWIRNGRGHVHEARLPIINPMNEALDKAYDGAAGKLMEYFEKDLAGRVKGNVHVNSKGKKI